MKFIIDNNQQLTTRMPLLVERALKILAEVQDGKLLTTNALAGRVNVQAHYFTQCSNHPALEPFKFKYSGRAYYGNQKTIKAANKEFCGNRTT